VSPVTSGAGMPVEAPSFSRDSILLPIERNAMTTGIVTLTTSTFDETVAAADKPVIVDFWAEWCGPCKMIAPILGEIADEQGDHLTIAKLNVDENPEIAMRFNVMSIPTLLIFDGGEVRKRLVGAKGKGQLLQELNEFLPTSR
jgi:thioredoxin 1